jgi:hypothetical protein
MASESNQARRGVGSSLADWRGAAATTGNLNFNPYVDYVLSTSNQLGRGPEASDGNAYSI